MDADWLPAHRPPLMILESFIVTTPETNYHFPTRIRRIESVLSLELSITAAKDSRPGPVQGRVAGSFAEWVVALALWYLKLPFIYKYQVPGTRFVIDFYIDVGPDWLPVDVRTFWGYQQPPTRRFRALLIERMLGRPPAVIWDTQVSTFEQAVTTLRRVIR